MAATQKPRNVAGFLFLIAMTSRFKPIVPCNIGVFGPNCEFPCHCDDGCGVDGDCDVCQDGFFGPGCQYIDLAYRWGLDSNYSFAIDWNDGSCNTEPNATTLTVQMSRSIVVYWIRIKIVETATLTQFIIDAYSGDGCLDVKANFEGDGVVDVYCVRPAITNKITLEGEMAEFVCSFQISEGRNVAYKQEANQSSTDSSNEAGNAVDGLLNTYSKTQTSPNEWWTINLQYMSLVLFVDITTDPSTLGNGYVLEAYNRAGEVACRMTYSGAKSHAIHQLSNCTQLIKSMRMGSLGSKPIALVEFIISGETVCPDDMYGIGCVKACACASSQDCHYLTGLCAEGCQDTHGLFCENQCSQNCLDGRCKSRSGNCYECKYGRQGDYCTEECLDGTYGNNCSNKCSQSCKGLCDKVNGDCLACEEEHYGPRCIACPKNTYGEDCSIKCPQNCWVKGCNTTSGECLICQDGFYGSVCVECEELSYGTNCSQHCASTCQNGCDKVTGKCYGCKIGNAGPYCSRMVTYEESHTAATILVFGLLILIIPSCMFLHKKKMDMKKAQEASSSSGSTTDSDSSP